LQEGLNQLYPSVALKQSVESELCSGARQHSSKWTEAEIHDRQRQDFISPRPEISTRVNEEGIPIKTLTDTCALVEIPSLQQGILRTTDKNIGEYTINVEIAAFNFFFNDTVSYNGFKASAILANR
jgi:hypothetical protein